MGTRRITGVLPALLLLSACAATPLVTDRPAQVSTSTSDDGIRLTLTLSSQEVAVGAPVGLTTTIEYIGDRPSVNVEGATSLVSHAIHQLDGERRQGAYWNLDCSDHILDRNEPVEVPLNKAVSWSSGDPDAELWDRYGDGADLRLPLAGEWQIDAVAWYDTQGDCNGSRRLTASVVVVAR